MSDARQVQVIRIGLQLVSADPFWVLVREAIYQEAEQRQIALVPVEIDLWPLSGEKRMEVIEEILALELHGLMAQGIGDSLARLVADAGVPCVILGEIDLQHPLVSSPRGLYEAACMAARFLADRIGGRGHVMIFGGLAEGFDRGQSRLEGFYAVIAAYPEIEVEHISTPWTYPQAVEQATDALSQNPRALQAIFGLSDSTALAGLYAARNLGLIDDSTVVVGINGDPMALTAIMEGSMTATVDTPAVELGRQAIDLILKAAQGQPLAQYFSYSPRLITRENVVQISTEKLMALASLPGRLVGINRHQEHERLVQLETSLEISRRVGSILDRQLLYREIADLIRTNYGYDEAQIFLWLNRDQEFVLDRLGAEIAPAVHIPLAESGLLGYTLLHNQPTFIPDMRFSQRFPPDPYWPATRSRVILLIHQGSDIIGLLDLHSQRPIQHSSNALIGLQALADQLGTVLHNVELYGEAVAARAEAERANQLKSRLLANISHEFRTPLNVIEGYSQAALATPGLYGVELPQALFKDLRHIYTSSRHLERLINDLLDLSKAEIGELDILTEIMDPHDLIEEAFEIMAGSRAHDDRVTWRLVLPDRLPEVCVDPVRLRQVLLNLLSNAAKFTAVGSITLGVQSTLEQLHIWVEDTGCGIPPHLQQRIFEAFSTAELPRRPEQGIGLGLRVTHELVKLHGGTIALTSKPDLGTTVRITLPLPTSESLAAAQAPSTEPSQLLTLPLHPDALPSQVSTLTRQAVAWFCARYASPISRQEIAESLGVTPGYLTKVFRQDLGVTPWEYLTRLRIDHAKELLTHSSISVTEIAGMVGYDDPAYFTRVIYHWPTVANAALATLFRTLFANASGDTQRAIVDLERGFVNQFASTVAPEDLQRSVAQGQLVGLAIFNWAQADGYAYLNNCAYTPPNGPGLWAPTPPKFAPPLQPCWGYMRPFVLRERSDECQPSTQPEYSERTSSPFYLEALEVYQTVNRLTPEQQEIARYWSDDAGKTGTPPGHSIAVLTQIARDQGMSLDAAAEAYAKLGIALADSFISCWQTKFAANIVRPVTYIQKVIDPSWTSPLTTPPFPEYSSGHSVQSGAAATVLAALFGDDFAVTDHTHDALGYAPRSFNSFFDMANEAAISRLYGGIHYRSAIEVGLDQGACIGERVNALKFRR